MAWEWSHTAEAYDNAYRNLCDLPVDKLQIIFAEWEAAEPEEFSEPNFNQRKYDRALKRAKKLPADTLADYIWEKASELATCDNGGWNAWVCPWGCHTVPFSRFLENSA